MNWFVAKRRNLRRTSNFATIGGELGELLCLPWHFWTDSTAIRHLVLPKDQNGCRPSALRSRHRHAHPRPPNTTKSPPARHDTKAVRCSYNHVAPCPEIPAPDRLMTLGVVRDEIEIS